MDLPVQKEEQWIAEWHVFEVPGPRDVFGVCEDTVMEVLTPVIGCQLADFSKTSFRKC